MEMSRSSPGVLLLLGFLFVSSHAAAPAPAPANVHDSFLTCLSNHSNPSNKNSSIVYTQTNPEFTKVLQHYIRNRLFDSPNTPKPLIMVSPTDPSQVQATVNCARDTGIELRIRSGGHDYDGLSYVASVPFIVLDMFNLRSIEINMADETAWVQAGASLGELYYTISEKSKVHAFPAGICATLGVGGHFSGGGYGNLLRKYGLSIDNVVDAQIVTASGSLLDRKGMGEDLFWAIRGGGGASFGVIVSYKIKLVKVPEVVTVFRVERGLAQNATEIVYDWQLITDKIDHDLFMRVLIQPVTEEDKRTVKVSFMGQFLGDSTRLMTLMDKEFPQLGLKKENCTEMSWIQSVLYWANFNNTTPPSELLNRPPGSAKFTKRKSDYVKKPIPKEGLEGLWKKIIELDTIGMVFNSYGGKMSEIPPSETPFPHRAGNIFKVQYSVSWSTPVPDLVKKYMDPLKELYSYMTPYVSQNPRTSFLNYRDLDIGVTTGGTDSYKEGKVYGEKYFVGNFERLVKVKTAVDPQNFFRYEQSIPTLPK